MVEIKPDEISAILRQQLSNFNASASLEEVGTVLQVGDGIARIYGMEKAMAGELVEFDDAEKTRGMVLNLEEDNVGVVILGEGRKISEGMEVPKELAEKFRFAKQKSNLAGIIRSSFFVIREEY